MFCCDSPCSCHVADVHAPCQLHEIASVHANVASVHAPSNMHVHNAPVLHTAPLVSIASDGTHLTSNQINRIALHKAKAIEIKRARRQAAHAALPRVDISATPEELAPVSMHMHGGATSHFRRRFCFGGVSAAVAVAHTKSKP